MQHIILIGFKHVGKSTIGKLLSEKIALPLVDLDREIEARYKKISGSFFECREIFAACGEQAFRALEYETLVDMLAGSSSSILSLGGGTPTNPRTHELLKGHSIVYITSPKEAVYERIMLSGKPAFLSPHENSYESFTRVWGERKKIYQQLATITVENNGRRQDAVEKIIALLPIHITL